MELGEPDDSGRRRPVPVKGSKFLMPADAVVIAIGNSPNPLIPMTTQGLELSKKGGLATDPADRPDVQGPGLGRRGRRPRGGHRHQRDGGRPDRRRLHPQVSDGPGMT